MSSSTPAPKENPHRPVLKNGSLQSSVRKPASNHAPVGTSASTCTSNSNSNIPTPAPSALVPSHHVIPSSPSKAEFKTRSAAAANSAASSPKFSFRATFSPKVTRSKTASSQTAASPTRKAAHQASLKTSASSRNLFTSASSSSSSACSVSALRSASPTKIPTSISTISSLIASNSITTASSNLASLSPSTSMKRVNSKLPQATHFRPNPALHNPAAGKHDASAALGSISSLGKRRNDELEAVVRSPRLGQAGFESITEFGALPTAIPMSGRSARPGSVKSSSSKLRGYKAGTTIGSSRESSRSPSTRKTKEVRNKVARSDTVRDVHGRDQHAARENGTGERASNGGGIRRLQSPSSTAKKTTSLQSSKARTTGSTLTRPRPRISLEASARGMAPSVSASLASSEIAGGSEEPGRLTSPSGSSTAGTSDSFRKPTQPRRASSFELKVSNTTSGIAVHSRRISLDKSKFTPQPAEREGKENTASAKYAPGPPSGGPLARVGMPPGTKHKRSSLPGPPSSFKLPSSNTLMERSATLPKRVAAGPVPPEGTKCPSHSGGVSVAATSTSSSSSTRAGSDNAPPLESDTDTLSGVISNRHISRLALRNPALLNLSKRTAIATPEPREKALRRLSGLNLISIPGAAAASSSSSSSPPTPTPSSDRDGQENHLEVPGEKVPKDRRSTTPTLSPPKRRFIDKQAVAGCENVQSSSDKAERRTVDDGGKRREKNVKQLAPMKGEQVDKGRTSDQLNADLLESLRLMAKKAGIPLEHLRTMIESERGQIPDARGSDVDEVGSKVSSSPKCSGIPASGSWATTQDPDSSIETRSQVEAEGDRTRSREVTPALSELGANMTPLHHIENERLVDLSLDIIRLSLSPPAEDGVVERGSVDSAEGGSRAKRVIISPSGSTTSDSPTWAMLELKKENHHSMPTKGLLSPLDLPPPKGPSSTGKNTKRFEPRESIALDQTLAGLSSMSLDQNPSILGINRSASALLTDDLLLEELDEAVIKMGLDRSNIAHGSIWEDRGGSSRGRRGRDANREAIDSVRGAKSKSDPSRKDGKAGFVRLKGEEGDDEGKEEASPSDPMISSLEKELIEAKKLNRRVQKEHEEEIKSLLSELDEVRSKLQVKEIQGNEQGDVIKELREEREQVERARLEVEDKLASLRLNLSNLESEKGTRQWSELFHSCRFELEELDAQDRLVDFLRAQTHIWEGLVLSSLK
ncbi:hypothetical protein IE53DRAFT_380104 [Violaceomyces palustris]|uniref:Uncharacterized protein n=1 Tax=Violaceomyces palustris TaxID=1673888 RepID=A0ACD0NW14_9BASI|nr:hypothetical protein IE53DRAFT_380104 [Violaceomyces palustris]